MPHIVDTTEIPDLLAPGACVFVQGVTAEPRAILDALAAMPGATAHSTSAPRP